MFKKSEMNMIFTALKEDVNQNDVYAKVYLQAHQRRKGGHMKKMYSGVFATHVKCTREETMRLLEKNDAQMLELLYHENCTSISLQPELVHTQVRESSIQ